MSHFVETMAYAGETPWHRLGKFLGNADVDADTMQRESGMLFRVDKRAVSYVDGSGVAHEIPGQYAQVRSDTGRPIENVIVGERYVSIQNDDRYAFARSLRTEAGGDLRFHTAGVLKGGALVWILCQLAGETIVTRRNGARDVTAPFLLLAGSNDGTSTERILHTQTRVVCWNTYSAAIAGAAASTAIRHTRSADQRMIAAAKALGYAIAYQSEFGRIAQDLANTPMSKESFAVFCAQLLTGEDDKSAALEAVAKSEGRSKAILENKADSLFSMFSRGRGNLGIDRYDALNAVTEFVDHSREQVRLARESREKIEKRLISAQFGSGADLKARALKLLTR